MVKFSEKLQDIFGIGLKQYGVIEAKLLSEKKKVLDKNNLWTSFCCLYVKLHVAPFQI